MAFPLTDAFPDQMLAGFSQGVNVLQAAGYTPTLGSSGTELCHHLGQCGGVNARRQVPVRIESRPSLQGGSLSGSKLSFKRNLADLTGTPDGEDPRAAKAINSEK